MCMRLTFTCQEKLTAVSVRCCWEPNLWQFCDGSSVTPEAGLLLADPKPSHGALLKKKGIEGFLMLWLTMIKYNVGFVDEGT